jgi:hypothetical protein
VVPRDTTVRFRIRDEGTTVDLATLRLIVNGWPAICDANVTREGDVAVIEHRSVFEESPHNTVLLSFSDTGTPPVAQTNTITFSTHLPHNPESITFVIEAEDFDLGGGQRLQVADSMPYLGGAYSNLSAVVGVDYQRDDFMGRSAYRNVGVLIPGDASGPYAWDRGGYRVTCSFRLGESAASRWFNYTRSPLAGCFEVWAAMSHGQKGPGLLRARLDRVVSGVGAPDQTVESLGSFQADGTGQWGLLTLVPLTDPSGDTRVSLSSVPTTLRLTLESGDVDYLAFGPGPSPQTVIPERPLLHCGELVLEFTNGTLEMTGNLSEPEWRTVATALAGQVGAYSTPLTNSAQFFRAVPTP